MASLSIEIPDFLHRQLQALAERDGVSMNHLVTLAIAEKTDALLTLDSLEKRAARGDRSRFEAALAAVPGIEPDRPRHPGSDQMADDFDNGLGAESSEGNEDGAPGASGDRSLADELDAIALRCSRRQLLDSRSEDEILGYGPDGFPE